MNDMKLAGIPGQAFTDVSVSGNLKLNGNEIKSIDVDAFSWVRANFL